jgi:hypothetical protein
MPRDCITGLCLTVRGGKACVQGGRCYNLRNKNRHHTVNVARIKLVAGNAQCITVLECKTVLETTIH